MRKFLLLMLAMIAGSAQSFADDSYELVTSESLLAAGDEVLIVSVSGSTYYAMGAKANNSNNRNGVNVSSYFGSDVITLPSSNTTISRFTLGGSSGAWTFYSETNTTGYLAKNGTSSTSSLTTVTTSNANCNVVLTISNTGATNFNFNNTRSRYLTYSASYFNLGNSNTNIRIFKKKIVVNAPTFSPAGGEYDAELNVTLSTTTADAIICYTTDGSTPTMNSPQYTDVIAVGEGTTTIKAIATLKGVDSEVVTATYVVKLPEKEVFHLVTDASQLANNDTLILVCSNKNKAMADQIGEGNRSSSNIIITGDSIILEKNDISVTRLVLGGSDNARTFHAINNTNLGFGYLYNSGSEGYLKTQETAGDYAKATISIAENGNATITFAAEGRNNLLAYYVDPDMGPGGDDPTPPIVGAKPFRAPVADSDVLECFTFIDAINQDNGFFNVQIFKKKSGFKDINMDGQLNIADVTTLVNYLLGNNSNNINLNACDVDNSGTVDAKDIPALVNIILTQE